MKGKVIAFLIVVLLIGILCWIFFLKNFITQPTASEYKNAPDLRSAYNADAEIAQALERLRTNPGQATVIVPAQTPLRQVAITFDGLADRAIVQKILDLLETHKAKATFFVDGIQTAEDPQTVINIKKAGHKIENYTLSGVPKMENLSIERLIRDFCRAQKIIKVTTDNGPHLLKCNDTQYTARILNAAHAAGFKSVVKNDVTATVRELSSDQAASRFVGKLRAGSIVSIKLKPNTDPIREERGDIDLKPAIDKQPGLRVLPVDVEDGDKEIVAAVARLLTALAQSQYKTVYVETYPEAPNQGKTVLRSVVDWVSAASGSAKNQLTALFRPSKAYAAGLDDMPATEIKFIPTVEPALAYSFSGLTNERVVYDVLNRLRRIGSKGTFFISEQEMQQRANIVRKIVESGHEIGIAMRPRDGETIEQVQKRISSARRLLHSQYGVKTNLVKQTGGAVADSTVKAAASLGCYMIGQSVTVVQSKHKDYATADQVMTEIFPASFKALARGQIVHFRLDYYVENLLAGDLVEAIKQQKIDNIAFSTFYDNPEKNPANDSRYSLKPIGAILFNYKYIYQYPANPNNIPPELLRSGSVFANEKKSLLGMLADRYIGNIDVNDGDRILNFSKMETRRLDKNGQIHTNENLIFLTFDDWGTDAAINKLLYVLRKHKVSATFFVLTRTMQNNPNLLRAIAVAGNDIGSHSDQHRPMAARDPVTGKQAPTQDNGADYVRELTESYRKLVDVTGDVKVGGKYSLTRFFRPPQLAINKRGLEAAFESGFEFIVNGSYSTHDYNAKDVPELIQRLKLGIYTENGEVKKGAVLIMHMSDTSIYTAVALDILLTANAGKSDSDPSKFKVARLSDYLINGYSQIDRKKSLELNRRTQ